MLSHFYGFNWLTVCVAAVVSGFKKAVSAVAAAVVGIGLFLAPMESAQGQSGIPEVTEFCIISNAASDYGLSRGYLACLPFFDFSGSSLEWVVGTAQAVDYSGLDTEDNVHDIGGVYGHFLFVPRDLFDNNRPILDGRWIKVSFYVSADPNSSSLSALGYR